MKEYQQKRNWKRRIFSKLTILVLAVAFLLLARSTFRVYQKASESSANLARVNSSLEETKARHDSLIAETERLKTKEGIEEEIRHKFQVSKEGEKVIVMVDDNSNKNATSTPTSFFGRLKYAILSFIK